MPETKSALLTGLKDYSETNPKPGFYACLYPELRKIAIECGYALGIHGSMGRDMDLIAVPWVEHPKPEEELVDRMCEAVGGTIYGPLYGKKGDKPHGRMTYTFSILGSWYIDLSVMPTRPPLTETEEAMFTSMEEKIKSE